MTEHRAPLGLLALMAVACLCTLINLTSCGGSSGSAVSGNPQQGSGELPGQQTGNNNTGGGSTGGGTGGGTGTGPTSSTADWGAGFYTPIPPQGTAGGSAPLGTVPEYQVTELGGSTSKESSRTPSIVTGEVDLTFEVTDVAMAANNVSPNWDASNPSFYEGDPVDLYIKYEIDPNFPLNRTWVSPQTGLDYVEPNVPHDTAGTYTAKLDFTLPWGTSGPAVFTGGLSHGEDSDTGDDFAYTILSRGEKTRSLYPQVPDYVRNDSQGGGCKPAFVAATFNGTTVDCESEKDLSNVVLKFADGTTQKWDGLTGKTGTFYGTDTNSSEQITPDAVIASSSFNNATLSRIDEDPSTDDTEWATASSNTASPNLRVSFATPAGTLSTGQNSQKFRVRVKKFNSNSGTPKVRLDVYENGTLKITGSTQNVTSRTGQVVEQTFNAGTMNKANIECRVFCTTGGSGSSQNSVSVGAVRWVADVVNQGGGKQIVGVWIKSGCNSSGDGPGYGEYLAASPEDDFNVAVAQMAFEDLITGSDYDYNDFVGRINAIETRNSSGNLVQIQFTLKAVARAAGYDADWQFNINGAFPGASATAVVNQYYASGVRHGNQKMWRSSNGASIPVFTPIRTALPNPPGSYCTNGIPGTQFIDGDYAEVTVVFDSPVQAGTYTPAPYSPELRVQASGGNVYSIGLWRTKGDPVDSTGRPLAFIIPDTYAWPLEGKAIWNSFSGFNAWIAWINNQGNMPSTVWWDQDPPVKDYFKRELFN